MEFGTETAKIENLITSEVCALARCSMLDALFLTPNLVSAGAPRFQFFVELWLFSNPQNHFVTSCIEVYIFPITPHCLATTALLLLN